MNTQTEVALVVLTAGDCRERGVSVRERWVPRGPWGSRERSELYLEMGREGAQWPSQGTLSCPQFPGRRRTLQDAGGGACLRAQFLFPVSAPVGQQSPVYYKLLEGREVLIHLCLAKHLGKYVQGTCIPFLDLYLTFKKKTKTNFCLKVDWLMT